MREVSRARLPWAAQSLAQLTLVRFREFVREPEAVFWTFFFPVVLAIGLGIAFRNKPAEVLAVAVVRGTAEADSVAARLGRAGGLKLREKGSRYIDFVIPGLLGMNIMAGGIWGLGFAIVEARRRNLLKRLVSTPMSRVHYLASFLFSRFVFLLVEVVVILGSAVLLFGVPVRGSLVQLSVVCVVSALAFGGLGLLIASRARTTEGVSGLMNLVMMPMWVLSGVFFSSTNFPAVAQPVIQALPLTATINALRATMLQGAGWGVVGWPLVIVAVWGAASFAVALRMFRWR